MCERCDDFAYCDKHYSWYFQNNVENTEPKNAIHRNMEGEGKSILLQKPSGKAQ